MNRRRPIELLIAAPFERERAAATRALRASLRPAFSPGWAETVIGTMTTAVAQVGVGPAASARRLSRLLDEVEPRRVLVFGVAGGLAPFLRAGDLVVADRLTADTGDEIRCDGELPTPTGAYVGSIHTVSAPVCSPAEKTELHRTVGASAVDMESHALAEVCRRRSIPCSVWRAVSDPVDAPLFDLLGNALREDGSIHLAAALAAIAPRPHRWLHVWRTRRDANAALATLQRALADLMQTWEP